MKDLLVRLHMEFAHSVAELSHCVRGNVGCVLTSPDGERILSFGYNGSYRGGPNTCTGPNEPGKCECIHAELNALVKTRPPEPFVVFCTVSPCLQCAKAIINAGATAVYFQEQYRRSEGVALLERTRLEVIFLKIT